MAFVKILFFSDLKTGICANDFKNTLRGATVNTLAISQINEPVEFITPLSGTHTNMWYSKITMITGDVYYIRDLEYKKLVNSIEYGKEV